jgi:ComF family protein
MKLLQDFISLFYPNICTGCNNPLVGGEHQICLNCLADLPVTGFEEKIDNPVAKVFWGRVEITYATAFCRFDKGGKFQHMLHQLKYKGNKEVGIKLGAMYGYRLIQTSFYQEIDAIIPVPLHPKKERARGFNQSIEIGKGMAEAMGKPLITNNLIRDIHTESQTRKGRFERWENVSGIFKVRNENELVGKHLLLIDDVVTTGATLEACSQVLLKIPNVKVSISTLATA